jgi:glycosyltransferase involved in cell wall biosynthesis
VGLTPLILVILPARNEERNIGAVLREAPTSVRGASVRCLVVDDASTDATASVAREHGAQVITLPEHRGGGYALRVGFGEAQRARATVAVTLDADGQHRFADLEGVAGPVLAGVADLVVGSRLLGEARSPAAHRAAGLRAFNLVLSMLLRRRVTDCASGYRALAVAALPRLHLHEDRHHTGELLIKAHRASLRAVEVPITILPRASGRSKKGPELAYAARFAATVWRASWG